MVGEPPVVWGDASTRGPQAVLPLPFSMDSLANYCSFAPKSFTAIAMAGCLVPTQAAKEAREAWEKEKSQASVKEERVVASYKESEGFQCSLRHSDQVAYEFGY
ncbi:hypothetical protein GW17_00025359 [Ensete ventricosum]|nr:hypothetical protein GW17_00025359 [Ensete ventricosum]